MGRLGLRAQVAVNQVVQRLGRVPTAELSAIAPPSAPGDRELLELALRTAAATMDGDSGGRLPGSRLSDRPLSEDQRRWAELWPGEHYRLLPALATELGARSVVEVGTFTGMGSIALREAGTAVITYDVVPWRRITGSVLEESDFGPGRLEQRIGDLGEPSYFASQVGALRSAQLIFIDGPKDRRFEPRVWSLLAGALAGSGVTVLFDDIRVANMISFWHGLSAPKLDITSLGHWSGTGLVRL